MYVDWPYSVRSGGLISEDGSDHFRWSFRWDQSPVRERLGKGHVYSQPKNCVAIIIIVNLRATVRSILRRAWQLLTAQKYDKLHKSEDNMFHNGEGTPYIDVG